MSRVTGAFVIRGVITNTSPVVIGTGRGESVDIEIARGYDGDRPYLPATALMGVLRHRIANDSPLRFFWGGEKDDDGQSHFIIEDLLPENECEMVASVRHGIRIDGRTGLVEHGAKFTYEILEPGAKFRFHAEALLRDGFCESLFLEQIGRVLHELSNGNKHNGGAVAVGAMVNKGFGRIRLEPGFKTWKFDFSKADHAVHWLEYRGGQLPPDELVQQIIPIPGPAGDTFSISADFGLASSLIIGSYSANPKMPDKTHLTCRGKQILSGASIKGALRARAVRIIDNFGKNGEEILKDMFGWAEKTGAPGGARAKRSRLSVEEAQVLGSIPAIQSRVKIDRFTCGASDSALYDSMPLWEKTDGSSVTIELCLRDFRNWEAGLLLHLLKDLWSGDLPIGGEKSIGRGALKGKKAVIRVGGVDYTISTSGNESYSALSFNDGARQALEAYAEAFLKKMEEK